MFKFLKYIILILICLTFYLSQAQDNSAAEQGTCQNPYQIKDTAFVINLLSANKDKIWFSFVSKQTDIFIKVADGDNQAYNYLIFKNTGSNFCNDISNKKLIPERNKVCEKSIGYDASTTLSYENINRGVCKCEKCCFSDIRFHAIPGETYYMVVYNPQNLISINFGNTKLTSQSELTQLPVKQQEKVFSKDIDIETLEIGQSIKLDNIYFEAGLANILSTSFNALDNLWAFLEKNKTVKIEIQGHVNGPNQPLDINYSNNLGYRRAREVYEYLINKGIDKERLSYKGFGNTQMVYPNAIMESEMAKNRRVEIMILSK